MSAVSRLWRRAPAWRFFLYASVLFLILGVLFPTPIVARHMAWTEILTRYLPSWASPSPNAQDSTASNDNANPSQPDTGNPKGDLTDPARFITPDITLAMTGVIPFGGHSLPLPAGIWHPVLSGQYGPNARMSLNVLARTDRGIVTGVIIASTTDQDVPRDVVEDAYNHCHDDRNYHSTVLADRPDGKTECTYLTAAYMGPNASISSDPLIQLAFKRLVTLGFPMLHCSLLPAGYIAAGHRKVQKAHHRLPICLLPHSQGQWC
ncbi:P-loop NTPase family protein [Asaia prunellae]|uniref:hypothetical protein n=1 Tax=Asaia prunellae TaxID=610245 RepID=UPI0004701A19|nr:hypothetical protein [Asaia prunellae]